MAKIIILFLVILTSDCSFLLTTEEKEPKKIATPTPT